jgi:hypothetical protein
MTNLSAGCKLVFAPLPTSLLRNGGSVEPFG